MKLTEVNICKINTFDKLYLKKMKIKQECLKSFYLSIKDLYFQIRYFQLTIVFKY